MDFEELDSEVEQADVIREKTGLCLLDIDRALKCVGGHLADEGSMGSDDHSSVRMHSGGESILSPSPRLTALTVEPSRLSPCDVGAPSVVPPVESDGVSCVAMSYMPMDTA